MKSVIITGCTSGVGKAFHDRVVSTASDNTQYVFIGRNLKRLNQNSNQVYYEIDLETENQVEWDCIFPYGQPESVIFISNAGVIQPLGALTSDVYDLLQSAINVNMMSPAKLLSSFIHWTERKKIPVRIINVSSGAAIRAIAGWGAYCMSKAGIRMFLDVIALENHFVDVVHYDPGVIDTNMQQTIRNSCVKEVPSVEIFKSFADEGKLKSPEDVAIELIEMCNLPV